MDLTTRLGNLTLLNPVLVGSGTFGYAREMAGLVNLTRLGGIIPKTITQLPRVGNPPWRSVETPSGMLNSIGLDNDGIDAFIAGHLPYLTSLGVPIIVSIAGHDAEEFVRMAEQLNEQAGIAALELNISCPNVSGGVDFATDCQLCETVIRGVRKVTKLPLIAKLTPNVAKIADIAKGAEAGGADAIAAINTCLGMAIDWRKRKPLLGNIVGGLSGPAIKPIALRCVYQISKAVKIPVIGIGGIGTIDDAMEFFVAGASAVQIGTANFYNPLATMEILDALPSALDEAGVSSFAELVSTLKT
jgi:dihydroorotate dehydrogenase (NAD+) catalytic subunit